MDENLHKSKDYLEKIKLFPKKNKFIIILLVLFIFLILIFTAFINTKTKKNNILISDKYTKAGLLLSKNQKKNAIKYYEELVLSKNKFYSLLALNTIIEKNLISDKEKIIKYFSIVEKNIKSKDKKDLLKIKKALYLIQKKNNEEGKNILNNLIKEKSTFHLLAEEVLSSNNL